MIKAHVLHLTTVHKRQDTRVFVKQCTSLAKVFERVTLLVADGQKDEIKNNVNIIDIGVSKNKLSRLFLSSFKILKEALKQKADLYHYHDPELTLVALILRLCGKKVIYDIHEDVPMQVLRKHWIPTILARFLSISISCIESMSSRVLSGIITVTPHIARRFSHANVALVRNYPDLQEFKQFDRHVVASKEKGSLVYVGAITKERGILQMLDALEFTPEHVSLHLIGPFHPQSLLEEAKSRPGWSKVKYYGWQDRDAVVNVLRKSEIGLVTLQPTGDYEIAYPVKMFEYMAAGLAIVSSDFPLYRSIVESANVGVCVDPTDPKAIAKGVCELVSNSNNLSQFFQNGPKAVLSEYNWDNEFAAMLSFYKSILNLNY